MEVGPLVTGYSTSARSEGVKRGDVNGLVAHHFRDVDRENGVERRHSNGDILPTLTGLNVSMVNNGNGELVPCTDTAQVHQFIEDRLAEVQNWRTIKKGKNKGKRVPVDIRPDNPIVRDWVLGLDAAFFDYHVDDSLSDEQKAEHKRRWIAENKDEIQRYLDVQIAHVTEKVGGTRNVVGYSVHWDETNPHVQMITIPVTETNELKWSAFEPAKPGGMAKFHRELREKLRAAGYDASLENVGVSRKHEPLGTFKSTQEARKKLARELDELPRVRAAAKARGWEEGRKEGKEAAEKAARAAVEKELAGIRRQTELNNAAAAEHLKRARELEEKRKRELMLAGHDQEIADQTLARLTNVSEVGQAALLSEISNVTGVPTENLRRKLDEVAATSDEIRTEFEGLFNRRAEQLAPKQPSKRPQPSFGPSVPEKSSDGATRHPGPF